MTTKEEILKEALKLFAKKGYARTSLEEIANNVGITKPAIYYYFKNKKHLYNEIFIEYFAKLKCEYKGSLEEDLKVYINKIADMFLTNKDLARLFSRELVCQGNNLEERTIKEISKTIKHLTKILQNTDINPFFIQTLIMSSFTNYLNTLSLREKVSGLVNSPKLIKDFDIKEEIYKTVILYIKAHK
ncbi:MAG: TetR/AcrR family transcriptional regulator [Nautiliaceae bacterium]